MMWGKCPVIWRQYRFLPYIILQSECPYDQGLKRKRKSFVNTIQEFQFYDAINTKGSHGKMIKKRLDLVV